jgi:nucleoside-diphosphate-sugar epimerase
MIILITGIHGFVGSNLVDALKANHTIYGLDIVAPDKAGVVKTFSWNEMEMLPSIDAVIHLAGKAHDTKNQADAQVYFDINTGLTKKIYDWFLQSKARKFIFFSSVKAAADKVEGEFLTEEVIPSPKGPYGESKIDAERYLLSCTPFVKQQEVDGMQKLTYILRPCMIHGHGNKGNLNLLYKLVSKGIPWPLGAYDNRRSFCSVDNLSFVVGNLIEKDIESGIYQVGDDESLSTNELITLIADTLGRPARIWKFNKSCIELAAKVGSVIHFPLNTQRLQKLTENYVISNQKIKKALDIEQMPVKAVDGLRKTIASFSSL